jgi:hypothetical protein
MFEVRTLRERSPYVEKPLLQIPSWHSTAGGSRASGLALANRQCKYIADTFREILWKYNDIGATRLVVLMAGRGWYPLTAEELAGWLARFYWLDGFFEHEQMQRLHAYLLSSEGGLEFVN